MAHITRWGDIAPLTAAYTITGFLKRAIPLMPLEKFAQHTIVPMGQSQLVKWRRYEPLPVTTAPVTEGVTPQGNTLTATEISATLQQYGGFIGHSDVIKDVSTDPVLVVARDLLAQQCAETLETVRFQSLLAGTNVFYANGSSRSAVNTPVSLNVFRKVGRALARTNTRMFTSVAKSTPSYGSQPVESALIAFIHPDIEPDIRGLSGFKHVSEYGTATPFEGEFGSVERIRFISSTVFTAFSGAGGSTSTMVKTGSNADVYPIIVLGMDAWASVILRGSSTGGSRGPDGVSVSNPVDIIVKNPGSGGAEDPLNQRGSVAWKTMFTTAILQDAWMARIEVAATEL